MQELQIGKSELFGHDGKESTFIPIKYSVIDSYLFGAVEKSEKSREINSGCK